MKYDYVIVGSGLFGSVFAYEMTKRGKRKRFCNMSIVIRQNPSCKVVVGWKRERCLVGRGISCLGGR